MKLTMYILLQTAKQVEGALEYFKQLGAGPIDVGKLEEAAGVGVEADFLSELYIMKNACKSYHRYCTAVRQNFG